MLPSHWDLISDSKEYVNYYKGQCSENHRSAKMLSLKESANFHQRVKMFKLELEKMNFVKNCEVLRFYPIIKTNKLSCKKIHRG